MSSRAFVVPVRDLEDSSKTIDGPLTDEWLKVNLADADVSPAGTGDGRVQVVLTKAGRDVLVRGRLAATVDVPCSRTLDPARYSVEAEVFLMLSPARTEAPSEHKGAEHKSSSRNTSERRSSEKKGREKSAGQGRSKRASVAEEKEAFLSEEDAAGDHYHGDEVVLDDFFREFILLEIPMVPLREDLRDVPFEGNPSPPGERPLDPRLSPLAELKARLEKKE